MLEKRCTCFCHFEHIRVDQFLGILHFKWGILHLENIIITTDWKRRTPKWECKEIGIFVIIVLLIRALEIDSYRNSKLEKSKWDNDYSNLILLSTKYLYFLVIFTFTFPNLLHKIFRKEKVQWG